ncbi:P-loop containing nucleoside triphosphate hydrolase protein, partial [Plenodomus tracheiphilus IPT5]
DVYATSFVPSVLRTINQLCAQVIPTQPRHCIDYTSYTRTFIGTSLIPVPIFHSSDVESQGIAASSDLPLTETSYHNFFVSLVNLECAAKEHENESHMLFQVPLQRIDIPLDGHIWALSLPGLREDSPLLEMGDVLQIRQLWVDHTGHSPSPFHGYVRSPYEENVQIQRWWTGVQYDGSIHAINRAKEMIYIRINELEYLYNGYGTVPMIANVVIPLNTVLIKSQNRAVAAVSTQLRRAMQTKNGNNHKEENNYMDEAVVNGHHELETNDWARRILFPTQADGQVQTRLRNVPHRALFDHAINYEQAHAVNDVCTEVYGTLPYLISGPPGTGKTKTVVEIAMQLLNTTDIAHVLICAPSEAAADTLALRLKEYLDVKQLFRLNRPGRADNEVPGGLLQYCCMKGDMFYLPPFKTLMAFNIVVTSCRDAAILAEARLSNDDLWTMERNMDSAFHPESPLPTRSLHWGALLIDEAAQATEIEALPALSIIIPPTAHPLHLSQPRFVMAGDERQLGPRTSSQDPKVSQSLFVRLSNRPLYATHPLSRYNIEPSSGPPVLKKSMLPMIYPPFTNLIRNYRSHPAILSVPSALFYNNTLIPEHHILSTPLQDSPLWRGRKWPVLFLPHTGADEIERENGGWYNLSEARLACSLAQSLYKSNVKQQDICIISPFAAQVKLLRSVIRSSRYGEGSGLWDVNIGPLEAFQGLEKRVVVLCTTRTRERFLDMDRKSGLGVVFQPRRMNVALTRAMEGLIVIGHPGVLGRDE